MRRALLIFAALLVACEVERPGNVRVTAPLQLDRATIAVDGTQTSWLMSEDLEHPVRELLRRFLGAPNPTIASGRCHVPAGTHTIRVVKPGWQPVERVIVVDANTIDVAICAADVRPLKLQ
jgi:hypothetical protein